MLAERLNVSRQAVSRWEMGSALPDASNILQLSRLFGVTADYLLNDEYESDRDVPVVKKTRDDAQVEMNRQIAFIILLGLNGITALGQIIVWFQLQSAVLSAALLIPCLATIIGFELAYRKTVPLSETAKACRRKFYTGVVWLNVYFPIRILAGALMAFYPGSYKSLLFELWALLIYLAVSAAVTCLIYRKMK